MGSLGSYIREAREARGIDLRDAAQQTRISALYLRAIEDEDFAKLPGPVFVKGFLKSYAKFLRLPEDEVMKRYADAGVPQPSTPSAAPAAPKHTRPEPRKAAPAETHPSGPSEERQERMGVEPFLWAGAVVIGMAIFIVTALPQKQKSGGHAPATASQGTATAGIATAPAGTVRQEKLYLDIVALEDAWVLVRTDTSPQKKAVLKKGESVTWSADERFLLSYSSVGAARLVLNGRELAVAGPKSAVVRDLIVTASGIVMQKVESDQPKPRKPKPVTQTTPTAASPASPQPAPVAASPQSPPPSSPPSSPPAAPASEQVAPIFIAPPQ